MDAPTWNDVDRLLGPADLDTFPCLARLRPEVGGVIAREHFTDVVVGDHGFPRYRVARARSCQSDSRSSSTPGWPAHIRSATGSLDAAPDAAGPARTAFLRMRRQAASLILWTVTV
jgi:hypothetical protein